jgi:tRNA threonylcarbamoyladenosine dehydratase
MFDSINKLYGAHAAARLAQAHVCVVGIGGVGSWAAEALARAGVGRLTLIDGDEVCVSNTNRQLHALVGTYGLPKVAVLAERLRAINPAIVVHPVQQMVTTSSLAAHLQRNYDYVLDACDSFRVKVEMIAFCKRSKIKLLVIGAAGGRADPTKICVKDLSKTEQDKLLALTRAKLREEFNFTRNPKRYFGVRAVFSVENVRYPAPNGGVCFNRLEKNSQEGGKLDCDNGLGVAVFVTASFGMVAASEIVSRLCAVEKA